DPARHRFSGSLVVGSGSSASVTPISGRAMPMMQVAMLTRALPPGAEFKDSVVEWVRMPMDKAGADAVTDTSMLNGMESRRSLDTKSIVRLRDLTKARLVSKGSLITMQVETPNMRITVQGRALGDGVINETVRVMNTQSNRSVDAVVVGKDKVSV